MKAAAASILTLAVVFSFHALAKQNAEPAQSPLLSPTQHEPLPADLAGYWLVPDQNDTRMPDRAGTLAANLARGVRAIEARDYAGGLPFVSNPGLDATPLADYAKYYRGIALQGLNRLPEADSALTALVERKPDGHLRDWARIKLAEVAFAREDATRAESLLRDLSPDAGGSQEEVSMLIGSIEEAIGHKDHALEAYRRVYYTFPAGERAADAKAAIDRLEPPGSRPVRANDELSRAERLFAARRWADASAAFETLLPAVSGDTRTLVQLRLAECDVNQGRFRQGRDRLVPLLSSPLQAEARYFDLKAVRGLGDRASYVSMTRALVTDQPESTWAAAALDDLASYYVIRDEDDDADRVFREILKRFPKQRYSERAAWKVGWAAYRKRQFAEAATTFQSAAVAFPRSDYRPGWLYWAARSREQVGDRSEAASLYRLTIADYGSSYYGRLVARRLGPNSARDARPASVSAALPATPAAIQTEPLMRALMAAELFNDALNEVRFAQRTWGDSPRLQATAAWIRYQQAQGLRAEERFAALRGAINTMRRAYPQFLSASGEELPPEILRIIFPLDYWGLIDRYSKAHGLDPYVIAALMAQESTFTEEIRSAANARGLMQVMPATGRMYARRLGIRAFTTASLSEGEVNVRIGARYFKDLLDRFGAVHYVLAAYNAGDSRVARWMKESPGLPPDEFIDNIPFPETQAYVKRILGTAEDYRRLYGGGLLTPNRSRAPLAD